MEARLESGGKQFKSSSVTFSPFLSNANVELSFPKWTRWMSRMCSPATRLSTHTHTHFEVGWWRWCYRRESWLSCFGSSIRPSVRPADTQEEWIIYRNHFLSGSSDWCDSWPPNSIILSFVTLEKKWNHSRIFTHPPLVLTMLPMLQRGQYGKQILGNRRQRNNVPFHLPKRHISSLWLIL